MTNRPDPMHPDVPVNFPVPIRECTVCGAKFVPISEKGTGSTHCPACRAEITKKAREKSLEMRRAAKAESDRPAFTAVLEWYSTATKLPDTSREVFIMTSSSYISFTTYSAKYQAFNASDDHEPKSAYPVAYWADMPENMHNIMEAAKEKWLEEYFRKEKEKEDK